MIFMKKITDMKKFSKRGIYLSTIILFSIFLVLIPIDVYANEVDVKTVGLEETSIITITNNSEENIKMFRIWLGGDLNFESFKTEKGWIGEKTPQGVIIFTSSEPINKSESVKFGIKSSDIENNIPIARKIPLFEDLFIILVFFISNLNPFSTLVFFISKILNLYPFFF